MASRRALASSRSESVRESDAVVIVEAVSKQYQRPKLMLWPPVVSIFDRGWFERKRPSEDEEASSGKTARASTSPAPPAKRHDQADDRDLDDDLDDDDDEDDEEEGIAPVPAGPRETFWALRDISFRLYPGSALGVLGGPDSGKSTLLRILGGQAFPTEGRVAVRDPVSPLQTALTRVLKSKGGGDVVAGCRLLGIPTHVVKYHRHEIEALAQPLVGPHGEPAPGSALRLALATAVILPSNVILLDEPQGLEDDFAPLIIALLRERLRSGTALILASRKPDLVRELCDEAFVLDQGSIVHHRGAKGAVRAYEAAAQDAPGNAASQGLAPSRHLSEGRKLRIPQVVPTFNASAALLSAELRTATGRAKRIDAADEASVEIRFETALPDIEVQCGIGFTPRGGDEAGIRLELPEPLRFVDPGTHLLVARILPGVLRGGAYQLRADAIVANPAERGATVIARDIGPVRITGDSFDVAEPADPPVAQWDGRLAWPAEAEWSIES